MEKCTAIRTDNGLSYMWRLKSSRLVKYSTCKSGCALMPGNPAFVFGTAHRCRVVRRAPHHTVDRLVDEGRALGSSCWTVVHNCQRGDALRHARKVADRQAAHQCAVRLDTCAPPNASQNELLLSMHGANEVGALRGHSRAPRAGAGMGGWSSGAAGAHVPRWAH